MHFSVLPRVFFATLIIFGLSEAQVCTPNLLSSNPDDIGFYLYTNQGNSIEEQKIVYNDIESLSSSAFNRNAAKTVIVIAGFTDNRTIHMPAVVVPAYLKSGRNYNIIVAEWNLLSGNCFLPFSDYAYMLEIYTQVVDESIPIVGTRVADFINFLNVTASKVHVVGHSLGAHVSGRVGANLQTKYNYKASRITGLDPAGPEFAPPTPSKNLDKGDAQFVDVIHSNMGANGDTSVDGHVDFYPNGGVSQPGCADSITDLSQLLASLPDFTTLDNVVSVTSCSHQFAPLLYATSLAKRFPACKCISLSGVPLTGLSLEICLAKCTSSVIVGVDCPTTARGLYSLKTGNPP